MMIQEYLDNITTQFKSYKEVADKTIAQLDEKDLHWKYNEESNSIASIIIHMSENMLSRWTDFFTSDGEKDWRDRDTEFEPQDLTKKELITQWEKGWNCLFSALDSLNEENFKQPILIRNKQVKLIESITRQIAHFPYHIGQIAYVGKMILNDKWQTASIAKGKSKEFIQAQFEKNNS
ncbi:DUF1572 family protein [Tenacibaculum caenipelagi]|uniref:Uncharacterized protein DUF1572 n=1 Tax=Tenacibaculum caenipelagi TaxID=1325435 RepID=A0A4V3D305_9FLAO|nr:DUF1572 family protein [Tenacibaculum caenipelagi]TDQ25700.1 uncharacterized protein DUF1572 [Tenacibaculum caenipelagi]